MVETNYRNDGITLPKCKQAAIQRYIDYGIDPGHFLSACLANDLMKAMGHADYWSRELLPVICAYIYNRIPMDCWGDWETVKNWHGLKNQDEKQEEIAT